MENSNFKHTQNKENVILNAHVPDIKNCTNCKHVAILLLHFFPGLIECQCVSLMNKQFVSPTASSLFFSLISFFSPIQKFSPPKCPTYPVLDMCSVSLLSNTDNKGKKKQWRLGVGGSTNFPWVIEVWMVIIFLTSVPHLLSHNVLALLSESASHQT